MAKAERAEVLVVGGGIGGLTTALALACDGRAVRVLERAQEFGEIGAGIQLAPNATRVLGALGVMEHIREVAVLPRRLVLGDALSGDELSALDLTDFPQRYGAVYVVLHRGDLLHILLEACQRHGVALESDTFVVRVENLGRGARAVSDDGRVFEGALLVGADGLHSGIRPLCSDDEPICSGYVAYRGAVPLEQAPRRADLGDVIAWIGPGLHFVQYPLRSGRLYNQVAVFRSDRYQRGEPDWGGPEELDERFSATCQHIQEALPALGREQRWPMYDRLPIDTFVKGRVALLGDAAHPMLQYLAQGACQAIEDAATLAASLRRHTPGPLMDDDAGIDAALRTYQEVRVPRTTQVQRTARLWGDIWHTDGLAKLLRDELLLRRHPNDHTYIEWLYGWQAPEGS